MSFKSKWKAKWKQLSEKYHLSVVNKDLFVEVYSLQFSKLGFYLSIIASIIGISVLTFVLIAFTSLKTFVPGYESDKMHKELVRLRQQASYLENAFEGKIAYKEKMDSILLNAGTHPDSLDWADFEVIEKKNVPSKIIPEHFISSASNAQDEHMYYFYKPVLGMVSQSFNPMEEHYGVDLVTEKNESVKAILDGRVLLSNWTAETGHIIVLQHFNDIISVYKHNSVLLKKTGETVKAGEVIAIVGNSGELSTGPHLHFEIWQNQNPLNPEKLINFDEE